MKTNKSKYQKLIRSLTLLTLVLAMVSECRADVGVNILSVDVDDELGFPRIEANVSVISANASQCFLTADNFSVLEDQVQQDILSIDCTEAGGLQTDIVIVFDDTGSMFQEIATMQEKATEFVTDIVNAQIDARFALISFKDVPRPVLDLTSNVNEFQQAVNSLFASSGGDRPEAALDAVVGGMQDLDFRPEALRVFMIITDAPTHYRGDGTLFSSFLIHEVAAIVNNQRGSVFVVSPDFENERAFTNNEGKEQSSEADSRLESVNPEADLRFLAEQTGGLWLDINSSSDFSIIIEQIIQALQAIYTITWDSSVPATGLQRDVCITIDDPLEGTGMDCGSYLTPPQNDDFADRVELMNTLAFNSIVTTNRSSTKEDGEPNHAGNEGGSSLWFEWTAPTAGIYAFHTFQFDGPDTLLAVYKGTQLSQLQEIGSSDDSPDLAFTAPSKSLVRFSAQAGETFVVAVDGKNGSEGQFTLWYYNLSFDQFEMPYQLVGLEDGLQLMNIGATSQAGEPSILNDPPDHSLWFEWTAPLNAPMRLALDASSALPPFSTRPALGAVYTGNSIESLTLVESVRGSALDFDAVQGTTYRIQFDGVSSEYIFSGVSLSPHPANDFWYEPFNLTGDSGTYSNSNVGATADTGEPHHAGIEPENSVWFDYDSRTSQGWFSLLVEHNADQSRTAAYEGRTLNSYRNVAAGEALEDSYFNEVAIFFRPSETTYNFAVDSAAPGAEYTVSWRLDDDKEDDAYEDNDTPEEAVDITGTSNDTLRYLVHRDNDYFIASVPAFSDFHAAILFDDASGDLDLSLFKVEGGSSTMVDSSSSTDSGVEEVSYSNTTAQSAVVRVLVSGDENDFYSLRVATPSSDAAVIDVLLGTSPSDSLFDFNSDSIIDAADIRSPRVP